MVKNIISILLLFYSGVLICQPTVYPKNIRLESGNPDTCNLLSFYKLGSGGLTGRGKPISWQVAAHAIQPYLDATGSLDTAYVNNGDSLVIIKTDGDTIFFAGGSSSIPGIDDVLNIEQQLTTGRIIDLNSNSFQFGNGSNFKIQNVCCGIDLIDPDYITLNTGGYITLGDLATGTYFFNDPTNFLGFWDSRFHNGFFGINTSGPTVALDVVGDANISGTINGGILSGNNSGDQDLSGYSLLHTTLSGYGITDGANINLSNLSSVAINTSLLPSSDNAIDLGSATKQWKDLYMTGSSIYFSGVKTLSNAGLDLPTGGGLRTRTSSGNTLLLQAYDVDGVSYTTFGTLTAGNTPTFDISSATTFGGSALSSLLGAKLNLSDTASMNSHWVERGDTNTMLTHYIERGDTSNMLSHYSQRSHTHTFASLTSKPTTLSGYGITDGVNVSDTSSMLTHYIERGDTASAFLHFIERGDTSGMLTHYLRRTGNGSGLTGLTEGQISGLTSDLALKLNISDTATMLTHFVERGDTASMLSHYLKRPGSTSITTLGTITTGAWNATVIGPTYGGTGVNNSSRTLTINTNAGTIDFTGASKTLTVPLDASVSGTNTGDNATNSQYSGLAASKVNVSDTATMLLHFIERGDTATQTAHYVKRTENITGSAASLTTSRNIGNVAFNGTANIVPEQIHSIDETSDATCFPLFITASGTQDLQPKNSTSLSYNSSTSNLTATTFTGALTGNASTATSAATLTTGRNINGISFNGSANISVPSSGKTFTWDGNGGIPATGSTIYFIVPTACTITGWSIWATGSSPTCTIDVWRVATGTALPTVTNTIMGTKPALSTGNAVRSTTLTGWSPTALAAGDIIGVNLDAVTVTTLLQFQLEFN